MVRYADDFTIKEFARPPPSGVHPLRPAEWDGRQQLPDEVLRSKLEKLILTQYGSVAFRETWTWTSDYCGDRRDTLALKCEPIAPLPLLDGEHSAGLLEWLTREYVPRRLERASVPWGAALPRRKLGVRYLDADGNFGDWRLYPADGAVEMRVEAPTIGNVNNTRFAREIDYKLRSPRGTFSYLPGDAIEVHYRLPVLKHPIPS